LCASAETNLVGCVTEPVEAAVLAAKSGNRGRHARHNSAPTRRFFCGVGLILRPDGGECQSNEDSNRDFEKAIKRDRPSRVGARNTTSNRVVERFVIQICVNFSNLWINFGNADHRNELDDGGRLSEARRSRSLATG
jgi:hypothetical protein